MKKKTLLVEKLVLLLMLFTVTKSFGQDANNSEKFTVTLLGTGTPMMSVERFGASTLVEAGDHKLVFDTGRGATIRLAQLGLFPGDIDAYFLTHLHSDHVNGLSDLWLTGWLFGRTEAMEIYGPVGTKNMMERLREAHQADIDIRVADENFPLSGIAVNAYEVSESLIYQEDGVRVTVFDVDHGELIKPSFGYRIDYQGSSVVISGDTRLSQNLIKFSQDADVLVHEVMSIPAKLYSESEYWRSIMDHHTSPEEAGMIFTETGVKLAVYSHIIVQGYADEKTGLNEVIHKTQAGYKGSFEIGYDLMSIEVSKTPKVLLFDSSQL
jgi:ribonuclease Z